MKFNNLFTLLVLGTMLMGSSVLAETLTVVAPESVSEGATGVTVNINVDTGINTAGASFTVTYDTSKLALTDVTSSYFYTFTSTPVTVGTDVYEEALVYNPTSSGVMLAGANLSEGATGSQTLFTLHFDVNATAPDTVDFNIINSTIENAAAGYTTPTEIPMLVGIDGVDPGPYTYPAIQTATVFGDSMEISSPFVDTDLDGIDDDWEYTYFQNLDVANATSDFDGDGYSDLQEYLNGGSYDPILINQPGGPGYVNNKPDSLIINFPGYGLYTYDIQVGFTKINSVEPSMVAAADIDSDSFDEIVAFFPSYGLYSFDNNSWTRLTTAEPEAIIEHNNGIAVDFGTTYGLYTYNTSNGWTKINSVDPSSMVSSDIDSDGIPELIVFFPSYGLYVWDSGSWVRITNAEPENMIEFNKSIAIDFGTAYGLYVYSEIAGWSKVNSIDAENIAAVDLDGDGTNELAATFSAYGMYYWDNNAWYRINSVVSEQLGTFNGSLVADFGTAFGLYLYDSGSGWTKINGIDPSLMEEVDTNADGTSELAVYFEGFGIYLWNNGSWGSRLNSAPLNILTSGKILH